MVVKDRERLKEVSGEALLLILKIDLDLKFEFPKLLKASLKVRGAVGDFA